MDKNQKRLLKQWIDAFWTEAPGKSCQIPQNLVDQSFEDLVTDPSTYKIHWILHPQLQTFAGFVSHSVVQASSGAKACFVDKIFVEPSYRNRHIASTSLRELFGHWNHNQVQSVTVHSYDENGIVEDLLKSLGFIKNRSWEDMTLGKRLGKSEWVLDLQQALASQRTQTP